MTCSATLDPALEIDARVAAQRLCGESAVRLSPITGGGNNRLFKVETGKKNRFALKLYGPADIRGDRLGREFDGLTLLAAHGVTNVAVPVAADRVVRAGLYQWIDGVPAKEAPDGDDIDQALSLVAALRRVGLDRNAWTGEAAEACLSLEALIGQVHGRLERLRNLNDEPGLSGLLRNELTPSLNAAAAAARTAYTTAGLDPVAEISAAQWVLSPSDFGLHNALRRADGRLIFIDFEYFGWDDPVKLTADFLWHPGMSLSDQEADCWWAGMLDLFADNPTFAVRLAAQAPLFAIRWCLIILNEFLPERWRRRVFAGGSAGDWMTAKAAQLVKARALLSRASIGGAALPSTNTTRPTA